MSCDRCGKASTLYFQMVDNFDTVLRWCPACTYRQMKAQQQYLEGDLQGEQDKHEDFKPREYTHTTKATIHFDS